jgi:hypothetical protein
MDTVIQASGLTGKNVDVVLRKSLMVMFIRAISSMDKDGAMGPSKQILSSMKAIGKKD